MFSGQDVPAVGVSIGIERVFAIMEAKMREAAAASNEKIRANETQVLVSSIGNGLQAKRMEIAAMLWKAGIAAEFGFKVSPFRSHVFLLQSPNSLPPRQLYAYVSFVSTRPRPLTCCVINKGLISC